MLGAFAIIENQFSYFSTKIYVVGTQKNRLDDTVLFVCLNIYVPVYNI